MHHQQPEPERRTSEKLSRKGLTRRRTTQEGLLLDAYCTLRPGVVLSLARMWGDLCFNSLNSANILLLETLGGGDLTTVSANPGDQDQQIQGSLLFGFWKYI